MSTEQASSTGQATSTEHPESVASVRDSFDQALCVLEAEYRLQAIADAQRVLHLYQLLQAAREHSGLFAATTAGGQTEEWVRRSLVWELSAAFHQSERKVMFLLDEAEALCEDFPATLDCLASGEISYQHAKTILTEATGLDEAAREEFEKEALPVARQATPPQFRKTAHTLRERVHPEDATKRKEEAVSFRHVQSWEDTNGMGWLSLYASAEIVTSIHTAAKHTARALASAGDARSKSQIEADAVSDALMKGFTSNSGAVANGTAPGGALTGAAAGVAAEGTAAGASAAGNAATDRTGGDPASGHAGGNATTGDAATGAAAGGSTAVGTGVRLGAIRPTVHVTVPVMTLMGHSEDPGVLDGYGPIDAETARRLAAQAPSFTRLLTHPETGAVLSVGRDRYTVPADLRRAVIARDKTCVGIGCDKPAAECDIDHRQDWQHGGETSLENLQALCKSHHTLKHHTTWTVNKTGTGAYVWTSPIGRKYTIRPGHKPGFAPVRERGTEPPREKTAHNQENVARSSRDRDGQNQDSQNRDNQNRDGRQRYADTAPF